MKKNHFYIALTLIVFSGVTSFALLGAKMNMENKQIKELNEENQKNEINYSSEVAQTVSKEQDINLIEQNKIPNVAAQGNFNKVSQNVVIEKDEILIKENVKSNNLKFSKIENEKKSIIINDINIDKNIENKIIPQKVEKPETSETIVVKLNKSAITNISSIDSYTRGNKITIKIPRRE